jgi:hypothetical protein
MRFSTFNEVVNWYNLTKPVVSVCHTKSQDVRPIGDRRYKSERIKKIDDNTYALLDGYYGNTMWQECSEERHAYENLMAPILWVHNEDGDYIRVRGANVGSVPVSRYRFLQDHLPRGMQFSISNNKHLLYATTAVWTDGVCRKQVEHFRLPKSRVAFDHKADRIKIEDNAYITFRANTNGTFTRVSPKLRTGSTLIDKDAKRKWRAPLNEFYQYCAAIAPIVSDHWTSMQEYRVQISEWGVNKWGVANWTLNHRVPPVDLIREVLTDSEHPLRVAVAAVVIEMINGRRTIRSEADIRSIRTAYNKYMNKAMHFYKKVEV